MMSSLTKSAPVVLERPLLNYTSRGVLISVQGIAAVSFSASCVVWLCLAVFIWDVVNSDVSWVFLPF